MAKSSPKQVMEAFQRNPDDINLFKTARDVLRQSECWVELLDLYELAAREAELPYSEGLLFAAGKTAEVHVRNLDRAASFYEQSFFARKKSNKALRALRALEESRGNWSGVLRALRLKLDIVTESTLRARVHSEIGVVYEQHLNDIDRALEAYQQALEDDPRADASLIKVENICRKEERWSQLIGIYKNLAQRLKGSPDAGKHHFRAALIFDEKQKNSRNAAIAFSYALKNGLKSIAKIDRIRRFAELHKKDELLLQALTVGASHSQASSGRQRMGLDLAALYLAKTDEEGSFARAEVEIQHILEENPKSRRAIRLLEKVYLQNDPGINSWISFYQHQITHLELSSKDRFKVFSFLASLYEKKEDYEGALGAYRGVLETHKRDIQAHLGLARMAKIKEQWDSHITSLDALVKILKPQKIKEHKRIFLSVQRQRAQYYKDVRQNTEREKEALEDCLKELAGDEKILSRLMVLADNAGQQKEWGRLLEQQAKFAHGQKRRHDLHYQLANFREQVLGDLSGACEAWELVDQIGEQREQALLALEKFYGISENHKLLASVLRRQAELFKDADKKAEALRKLGCHLRDKLYLPREAAHTLRDAWAVDPAADDVIKVLQELLITEQKGVDTFHKTWVLREISQIEDAPERRYAIRRELAAAFIAQERDDEALAILGQLLQSDPSDGETFAFLVEVLERQNRLSEIWFFIKSSLLMKSEKVLDIARRVSKLYDDKLKDEGHGPLLELWKHAVELAPKNEEAARAYVAVARSLKAPERRAALEVLIELVDPVEEHILRIELGRLHRDHGQLIRSRDNFRRAYEIDPREPSGFVALRSVLALLNEYEELFWLLEDASRCLRADHSNEPTKELADRIRRLELDAAELAEEKLENPKRSLILLEACHLDFSNIEVVERLIPVYRKLDRKRDLAELLGEFIELSESSEQRTLILLEKIQLDGDLLEKPEEALQGYNKCIEDDPGNADLWLSRAVIHERLGEWKGALIDLAKSSELSGACKSGLAALERRRGLIYRDHLQDDESAESCLKKALRSDPDDLKNHNILIDFYERRALYPQLQETLSSAASHVADQDLKAALLARRGEVLARFLGRIETGIEELNKALALCPGELKFMDLKIRLLRHTERPKLLIQALQDRRNALSSEADDNQHTQRGVLLREEGLVHGWELGDFKEAQQLLVEAITLVPERLEWIDDALLMQRLSKDSTRHLNLLKTAADRVSDSDPQRSAVYLIEAGVLCLQQLKDPDQARLHFEAALETDEQALEALRWLQMMAAEDNDAPALLAALIKEHSLYEGPGKDRLAMRIGGMQENAQELQEARRWYEKAARSNCPLALARLVRVLDDLGEAEALFEMTSRLLEFQESAQRRRIALVRLAERLVELGDKKRAKESYRAILKSLPEDSQSLRGLIKLLDPKENIVELVALMERECSHSGVGLARFVELQIELGQIHWRQLGDAGSARKHFEAVLERSFYDESVRDLLKQCYIELHDWTALAEFYESLGRAAIPSSEKETCFRQAALIYHHHEPQNILKAKSLYLKVLKFGDPECVAIEALPGILKDHGDLEEQRALLSLTAQIVPGSSRARQSLIELGQEWLKDGDYEQAVSCWSQALGWSSGDPLPDKRTLKTEESQALQLILEAEREQGHWRAICDYLSFKISTADGREDRRMVMLERAIVIRDEVKDEKRALEIFEHIFESDPTNEVAIEALRELYQRFGRIAEWSHLLGRAADHSRFDKARCQLLLERVDVDVKRGELFGAIECLRRVASYQPNNLDIRKRLAKFQQDCGDDHRLLVTLEELASLAEGEERLEFQLQKSSVLAERLSRVPDACELLERLLEEVARRESPNARQVVSQLKKLTAQIQDDRRALLAYETEFDWLLLRARKNRDEQNLRREVEISGAKLGRLFVGHDDLNMAESCLERGLEIYPESKVLFSSLRAVVEASALSLRLVEVIERRCQLCESNEEIALRIDLAELLEEELGDPVRALDQWQKHLALCPASFAALRSIQRLCWANQREKTLEFCERELEQLEKLSPEPWLESDPETSDLSSDLSGERLISAFEKRSQKAKHYDLKALLVDTAHYSNEDIEGLVGCLSFGQELQQTMDRERSSKPSLFPRLGDYVSRLYRKAAIIARDLDDLDRAAGFLGRALFFSPNSELVILHLSSVHELRKDWKSLASVLRTRWGSVTTVSERVSLGLQLADLEQKRGQKKLALELVEKLWQDCMGHRDVLIRMKALQRSLGDHAAYVRTLHWEAEQRPALEDGAALYLEAARTLDHELKDPENAIIDYERAQALRPDDEETRNRLCELLEASGNYQKLVDLLKACARLAGSVEASSLYEEAAKWAWEKLESADQALSLIDSALRLGCEKSELFDRLIEIQRAKGHEGALAKALKQKAQQVHSDKRVELYLEVAKLEQKRDPQEASRLLNEALCLCSKGSEHEREALSLLVSACRQDGQKKGLLKALERRLEDETLESEKRSLLLTECSELAQDLGADYLPNACKALEQKHEMDSSDTEVLLQLIELHKNQPVKRLGWIDRMLMRALDRDKEEPLLSLVADLSIRVFHEPTRAISAYQRLLELNPDDRELHFTLFNLFERSGRYADALEALDKELKLLDEKKEISDWFVDLVLRKARILEEMALDLDAAYECYKSVLVRFKESDSELYQVFYQACVGFLRRRERFDNLAELLEEQAQYAESKGQEKLALQLWQEQAAIYGGCLENIEASVRCFENIIRLEPEHRRALIGMQGALRILRDWKRLELVLEKLLPLEDDLERRAWMSYSRGVILEEELTRLEDAMEAYELAIYVDPLNLGALRRLTIIYEGQGNYEDLCRVVNLEARALKDPDNQAVIYCRLGHLYKLQLSQPKLAEEQYRKALELKSGFMSAYQGLSELLRDEGLLAELAMVLEEMVDCLPQSKRRRLILSERAEILEREFGILSVAADIWSSLLEDYGLCERTFEGLLRCKRRSEDWKGVADLVESAFSEGLYAVESEPYKWKFEAARALGELARAGDDEALKGAFELALEAFEIRPERTEIIEFFESLCVAKQRAALIPLLRRHGRTFQDKDEALKQYRRAASLALEINDDSGAQKAFEDILEIRVDDAEAIKNLEQIASRCEDWPAIAQWLEKQLVLELSDDRLDLYQRLGQARERLGETTQAVSAFESALDLANEDQAAALIELLLPCVRSLQRWDDLAVLLKKAANFVQRGSGSWIEYLSERANILTKQLKRHDLAAEVYDELWSEPLTKELHQLVFRSLTDLLTALGRFERLKSVLLTEADYLGPEAALIWLRLGQLVDGTLANPEGAAVFYRKAHDLKPDNLDILANLKDMLYRLQRWDDLIRVLKKSSQSLENSEQLYEIYMECGVLSEDQLGDVKQAERFYLSACRLELRYQESYEALARVQQQCHHFVELILTLEELSGLSNRKADKISILKRIAKIYQYSLLRQKKAFEIYQIILSECPGDSDVLEELLAIHYEEGNEELAAVFKSQAAHAGDPQQSIEIYLRLAELWSERLKSPQQAVDQALNPALKLDPLNTVVLAYKLTLIRKLEQWESVVEILHKLVSLTVKGVEQLNYHQEIADTLHRRLHRGGEAQSAIDQLVQSPMSTMAHLAFAADFYRKSQLRLDLVRTLKIQRTKTEDAERQASILAEIAWIELEQGNSRKRVFKAFREALEYDPDCVSALWGLARGESSEETIDERLAALNRLRGLDLARPERMEASLLAASICREEAEDFEAATAHLTCALSLDASCYKALVGLAELYYAQDEWDKAAPYFKGLMRCREFGEDSEHAADLLHAHGVVYQKKDREEDAASAFRRALEYQPEHLASLEDLGQSMLTAEAWEAAVKIFEKLIQRTRIPKARAAHELSLAQALKEVGDIDRSLDLYRQALEQNPGQPGARLQYAQMLIQQGNVDGARVCFEQVLSAPGVESIYRGEALVQLADLYTQNYRDATKGTALLTAALEQPGPHRSEAAKRLAEIYGHNERWTEAAQELTRAIEFESQPLELSRLWAALGRLTRDRLSNPEYARRCFENSVQLNPEDAGTLDSLIRLLRDLGHYAAMDQVLNDAIARSADQYTASSFRLERADLLWKQFSRNKEAIHEYESVLAVDPEQKEARTALARLYVEVGDEVKALEFHRDWLAESALRVGSYRALAAVFQGTGKNRAYIGALHALAVLRAASPEELGALQSHLKHRPEYSQPINEQLYFTHLSHPEVPRALARILKIIGPSSSLLFPSDLQSYGLERKNIVKLQNSDWPHSSLILRVLNFFELQDQVDVHWMAEWRRPEVVIERAERVIVMIGPAAFEGLNDNEILFLLGRQLAAVYGGYNFVFKHGASGLYRLVKMVAEALSIGSLPVSNDSEQVKKAAKMLARQLKVKGRQRIAPLVEETWEQRTHYDFAHICQALDWTASRAGALLAGGAYPAVECQFKNNVLLGGRLGANTEDVQRQLRDNQLMKELLRYSVSKEYHELLNQFFA
jgi:golgin subfamily B member 1